MNHIQIIEQVYNAFSAKITQGEIPISLRAPALVGTVQDDPFDELPVQRDVFKMCKARRPKERTASMPQLPE